MVADDGNFLYPVLLGLSWFGAGTALYLAGMNIRNRIKYHEPHLRYAAARLSWVGIVLLISEAVFHVGRVIPSWRVWIYLACLAIGGVSFILITMDQHHKRTPKEE